MGLADSLCGTHHHQLQVNGKVAAWGIHSTFDTFCLMLIYYCIHVNLLLCYCIVQRFEYDWKSAIQEPPIIIIIIIIIIIVIIIIEPQKIVLGLAFSFSFLPHSIFTMFNQII